MTAFSPIASLLASLGTILPAAPAPAAPEASVGFLELLADVEVAAEDLETPAAAVKDERAEDPGIMAAAWAATVPLVITTPNEPAPPHSVEIAIGDVEVSDDGESWDAQDAPAAVGREFEFAPMVDGDVPELVKPQAGDRPAPATAPAVPAPLAVEEESAPRAKNEPASLVDAPSVTASPEEVVESAAPRTDPAPVRVRPVVPEPVAPERKAPTPERPAVDEPARLSLPPVERDVRTDAAPVAEHREKAPRREETPPSNAPPPPLPKPAETVVIPSVPEAVVKPVTPDAPVEERPPARRVASPVTAARKLPATVVERTPIAEPARAAVRPHLAFGARLTPTKEPAEKVESKPPAPRPEAPESGEASPAWSPAPRETAAATERPETPAPAEAVKTTEAKPVAPRRAVPLPAPVARDIRLEVGDPDRKVEVRLVERAGEVRVAVRTPDDRLADGLREQLPSLSSRLEQNGFRADEWKAAAAGGAERRLDVDAPAMASDSARQQGQPQDRGQERRESEPRPHGDPEQESRRQKEKGNPFAWLMESLR